MRTRKLAPMLVLGAFLAAACDGTVMSVGTPTTPSVESASFSVMPSTLAAQRTTTTFCPSVPPFSVPLTLFVRAGSVSVVVTEISMRFVDSFGVQMPQVTLPAPVLTAQFGTALVEARSGRSFPLTLGVGCGTGSTGTIIIIVQGRDGQGHTSSTRVTAIVR